jgi:hypothetical protein
MEDTVGRIDDPRLADPSFYKDGGTIPNYAKKLSDLLNEYQPQLIGLSRGMVSITNSVSLGGGDLSNKFKGFGSGMDIKNLVYNSLKDENSHKLIEKLTNGMYKLKSLIGGVIKKMIGQKMLNISISKR